MCSVQRLSECRARWPPTRAQKQFFIRTVPSSRRFQRILCANTHNTLTHQPRRNPVMVEYIICIVYALLCRGEPAMTGEYYYYYYHYIHNRNALKFAVYIFSCLFLDLARLLLYMLSDVYKYILFIIYISNISNIYNSIWLFALKQNSSTAYQTACVKASLRKQVRRAPYNFFVVYKKKIVFK